MFYDLISEENNILQNQEIKKLRLDNEKKLARLYVLFHKKSLNEKNFCTVQENLQERENKDRDLILQVEKEIGYLNKKIQEKNESIFNIKKETDQCARSNSFNYKQEVLITEPFKNNLEMSDELISTSNIIYNVNKMFKFENKRKAVLEEQYAVKYI
jgi:hypothetical protein